MRIKITLLTPRNLTNILWINKHLPKKSILPKYRLLHLAAFVTHEDKLSTTDSFYQPEKDTLVKAEVGLMRHCSKGRGHGVGSQPDVQGAHKGQWRRGEDEPTQPLSLHIWPVLGVVLIRTGRLLASLLSKPRLLQVGAIRHTVGSLTMKGSI